MKRILLVLLCCLSVVGASITLTATQAAAQPAGVARQSLVLTPLPGHDLYQANVWSAWLYRKSPSLMAAAGNVMTQWYCAPGSGTAGSSPEAIGVTTSNDGGNTWGLPSPALLTGTPGGPDSQGVCDPSVVKIGSYYYLAYAGKRNTTQSNYQVFVARSTAPGGPFQKWTGTGWGNAPLPTPILTSSSNGYGATSPSLVVVGSTLFVYYDYHVGTDWQTRLATVDIGANVDTWPYRLKEQGTVLEHPGFETNKPCFGGSQADGTDVKFLPSVGKFVAVTSDAKTFGLSTIQTYESSSGLDFAKSITKIGDFQKFTQNVSLVGNSSGQIADDTPKAIAYSHADSGICAALAHLTMSPIQLTTATTGWADEPLTSSAASWTPRVGQWAIDPDEDAYVVSGGTGSRWSTLTTRQFGDSTTIDLDFANTLFFSDWSGVQFGQDNATDSYIESGYLVRVHTSGKVYLFKEGSEVANGSTTVMTNNWFRPSHLQIVQSNGNVSVYVDQPGYANGGMALPALTYVDDATGPAPNLGGYLSLVAAGNARFSHLRVTDNVPNNYSVGPDLDWEATTGSWVQNQKELISTSTNGQIFLRDDHPVSDIEANAHLGDGTYRATVQLAPTTNQDARIGLSITNDSTNPRLMMMGGGYQVFLRANGLLTVAPATRSGGVQNIPTGTNPVNAPVQLRVVKRGRFIQVYVNDDVTPVVNWADTVTIPSGGFGLANTLAGGTFTEVSYDADNGI